MPIRASEAEPSSTFKRDLQALTPDYPDLQDAVDELTYLLCLGYDIPHWPVVTVGPDVYAVRIDYAPLGKAGAGLFLVTYHANRPNPGPATPYQQFTLLTITKRSGP